MTININDLTIGQAKELAALFGNQSMPQPVFDRGLQFGIGSKVIIRTYSAGVWFGVLEEKAKNEVILRQARRLWQWKASESISLSAVANFGVEPKECRFPAPVDGVWLEAIEIIPCTAKAIESIEGVEHGVAR